MKAYVVGLLEMNNWNWYDEYYQNTAKLIEKYGGKYIASGIKPDVLEGKSTPNAHVILEFPSIEDARSWYQDPEYKKMIKLRQSGGSSDIFIFPEGIIS
jgi:uncharacterized protein (DUF1330 family)